MENSRSYQIELLAIEPWNKKMEGPYYRTDPDPGFGVKNYEWLPYQAQVEDARPQRDAFDLDTHGFAFLDDLEGAKPELLQSIRNINDEVIKSEYYAAVENTVKHVTGAERVIIFNHTIRKRDPAEGFFGSPGKQQPGKTVSMTLNRSCFSVFALTGFSTDSLRSVCSHSCLSYYSTIFGLIDAWVELPKVQFAEHVNMPGIELMICSEEDFESSST